MGNDGFDFIVDQQGQSMSRRRLLRPPDQNERASVSVIFAMVRAVNPEGARQRCTESVVKRPNKADGAPSTAEDAEPSSLTKGNSFRQTQNQSFHHVILQLPGEDPTRIQIH